MLIGHSSHTGMPHTLQSQCRQDEGISGAFSFIGSTPIQDEGFTHGAALLDVIGSAASLCEDFKLRLSACPKLTFDEALHRYRDGQKAIQQQKWIKL